jgi:hypothetical protein
MLLLMGKTSSQAARHSRTWAGYIEFFDKWPPGRPGASEVWVKQEQYEIVGQALAALQLGQSRFS